MVRLMVDGLEDIVEGSGVRARGSRRRYYGSGETFIWARG